jgi:putative DNA primase/helicase
MSSTSAPGDDRPPRPTAKFGGDYAPVDVDESLRELDQWICWVYEWNAKREEWVKVPKDPNSERNAKSSDPDTWGTFEEALDYHEREGTGTDGLGIMFSDGPGLAGIDLDGCLHPETQELEPWAKDIIARSDSYTETSPSGLGVHVLLLGIKPGDRCRRKQERTIEELDNYDKEAEVEMYDSGRYFTFTGERLEAMPSGVEQRNSVLSELHEEYVAEGDTSDPPTNTETNTNTPAVDVDLDDSELLEKARNAENGRKFEALFDRGDTSDYARADNNGASEADLALCSMLAFWTGEDRRQIDSLFRQSTLMRKKWDSDRGTQTYGGMTIDKAISGNTEVYDPSKGHSSTRNSQGSPTEEAATDGGSTTAPAAETGDTPWTASIAPKAEMVTNQNSPLTLKEVRSLASLEVQEDHDFMTPDAEGDDPDKLPLWVYESQDGCYEKRGKALIGEEATGNIKHLSTSDQNEIARLVTRQNITDRDKLDAEDEDHLLINLENGVYDFDEDELLDHSSEYNFRRVHPFEYDPDATGKEIEGLLDEVVDGEIHKQTILEFIGYCFEDGYPEGKFMLFHGTGGNGKGIVFDVIQALLGKRNTSSVGLDQMLGDNTYTMAELDGSMVNIDGDIKGTHIDSRELNAIKKSTGRDPMIVQRKFEHPFELRNRAKLMFAANQPPRFDDSTNSVARRLLTIEFPYEFVNDPDPEKNQKQKRPYGELMDELTSDEALSGLFNLAMDAYRDVKERGMEFSIEQTGSNKERFEDYQRTADPIVDFAATCLTNEQGFAVPRDALYAAYTRDCEKKGKYPAQKSVFFRKLRQNTSIEVTDRQPCIELSTGKARPRVCDHLWLTPEGVEYLSEAGKSDTLTVMMKLHTGNADYAEDFLGLSPPAQREVGDNSPVPDDAVGYKADCDRLCHLIRNEGGMDSCDVKPQVGVELDDFSPERVDDVIEYALEHDRLIVTESDRLEVV